jgi:hypothetical protein
MAEHVFEEDPAGSALADDAGDVGPQMARVGLALALARRGEWLARISRREDVDAATPGPAVECADVAPDRGVMERAVPHPRREDALRECVPLDIGERAVGWLRDGEAELEPADA